MKFAEPAYAYNSDNEHYYNSYNESGPYNSHNESHYYDSHGKSDHYNFHNEYYYNSDDEPNSYGYHNESQAQYSRPMTARSVCSALATEHTFDDFLQAIQLSNWQKLDEQKLARRPSTRMKAATKQTLTKAAAKTMSKGNVKVVEKITGAFDSAKLIKNAQLNILKTAGWDRRCKPPENSK